MEPLRPSAVILSDEKSGVPEATQKMEAIDETRAKARQRLRKKLAGDLDNIILMALRKEPHRRYVSAGQFSEGHRPLPERPAGDGAPRYAGLPADQSLSGGTRKMWPGRGWLERL